MTYKPSQLSQQAFGEFKAIYEAEFKETVPDADLEHMAVNMLELFALILKEQPSKPLPKLTEDEEKAYRFIREEQKQGRKPTARSVAKALGLRSSRSGFSRIQNLASKGLLNLRDT